MKRLIVLAAAALVFAPTASRAEPATLSLTLGAPPSFGAFTPGVTRDYTASMTALVSSTATTATLTVHDDASTNVGHLVNGAFSLPQALETRGQSAGGAGGAY